MDYNAIVPEWIKEIFRAFEALTADPNSELSSDYCFVVSDAVSRILATDNREAWALSAWGLKWIRFRSHLFSDFRDEEDLACRFAQHLAMCNEQMVRRIAMHRFPKPPQDKGSVEFFLWDLLGQLAIMRDCFCEGCTILRVKRAHRSHRNKET